VVYFFGHRIVIGHFAAFSPLSLTERWGASFPPNLNGWDNWMLKWRHKVETDFQERSRCAFPISYWKTLALSWMMLCVISLSTLSTCWYSRGTGWVLVISRLAALWMCRFFLACYSLRNSRPSFCLAIFLFDLSKSAIYLVIFLNLLNFGLKKCFLSRIEVGLSDAASYIYHRYYIHQVMQTTI
jgi:hypothetical protein